MTSIDNLAEEIMQGLQEYADLADTAMKKAVRKSATQGPCRLRFRSDDRDTLSHQTVHQRRLSDIRITDNINKAGLMLVFHHIPI